VNDPGEDGRSSQDTQSETSLVLDGSTVMAAFNDSTLYDRTHMSYHFTGYAVSGDGGQSFQDGGGLPTVPGGDAGDPVLARDNVTGRVYFATLNLNTSTNINVFRSDTDLQSFLPTTIINRSGGFLDKEWMAVDNFDGAGQGNVYLIVRDFGSGNGIFLYRSTDQGATFNSGVSIASGSAGNVQGAWVTVGPDHSVYAFWFDNTSSTEKIMMRKSADGGLNFGAAVTVTTLRTTGVNGDLGLGGGFRSNSFPQALANRVTGQLYVVYDDKGAGNDKSDVYFRYSNDGGTTWSAATDVIDDTTGHDQWQPALAVTPNGNTVGVFWYDRRVDPANNLIDRFGALGTVAGGDVTFGRNFRITDTSFPVEHGHDNVVNSVYMGDYDQAVADNTGFYLTWGDNRNPSLGHTGNNADVRFTHITVSVAGPAVIAVTPRGAVFPPVGTLRVVFDEPIDPTTFTADQFQLADAAGNPINITGITPADTSNVRFDVTFDTQTATGVYYYKVGPYIADPDGNYMDQDGNGIPGEDPDDAYFGSFSLFGPKVNTATPTGNNNMPGSVNHVRLTFNEPMDPTTFTPDQVVFAGPDGSQIPITNIQPVSGSNNTQFDISFDTLNATGAYSMVVGPYITDRYGNFMDQNGNFIPGEYPDDQFVLNFGVFGPKVTAITPTGNANLPGSVNHIHLTFNESMDPSTFTTDEVYFAGPDGSPIPINDIRPTNGTNNTQFDISFDPLGAPGTYHLVIGPYIADTFGNYMDQNGNLIPGEYPDDQFTATFGVTGPQVTQFARNGQQNQPVSSVRVTFNEPIDPATFMPDQIARLIDPQGNPITVTDVQPVNGSNNTKFDISFDTQSLHGTYTLQIAAGGIADLYGNTLAAAYTAMFIVTPVYSAAAYDYEPLDIHGLPGTFRVIQYADDTSVAVNLGSHTFNFYGVVYTGNNQLFASSNGLITFGSGNPAPGNTDLTTQPTQPAIAVLWADWIKLSGPTDMLEGYFDDTSDRLILQWNTVQHYPSSPRGITFQLILYLDTGGQPGDIVFNYVDLNTGDANRNGQTATVGIKSAGNQGLDRVLVSYNHSNPLIGNNLAILVSADQGGPPRVHGQHGRQVSEIARDSAAVIRGSVEPAMLASQPLATAPGLPSRVGDVIPLALRQAGAVGSLDQVFTGLGGADLVGGVHQRHATASDGIDPMILDLLEQASTPV
jgi:methionine-rich copper-binding protein CopC